MKRPSPSIDDPACESPNTDSPRPYLARLRGLWRETGDQDLLRLSEGEPPRNMASPQTTRDWTDAISTGLMTTFKETGNANAFDLLVELNHDSLLQAIGDRLRGNCRVDAHDVLQEALMNICRYRKSFRGDIPGAFRKWGHRIATNTACKLFKVESRSATLASDDNIGPDVEDRSARSPFRSASEAERAKLVNLAYVTYLNVYLLQYQKRSPKEQRALSLVELKGATYKEAAADLGIRVETLKMLIFRARRKILRGVERDIRLLPSSVQS